MVNLRYETTIARDWQRARKQSTARGENRKYAQFVSHDVVRLCLFQVALENQKEADGLVLVALDAVGDLFGCIVRKVDGLFMVGPEFGSDEEEPVVHIGCLCCTLGEGDFVVFVVMVNQILHDRASFCQADLLAGRVGINQQW
jgi:hypothetical protein